MISLVGIEVDFMDDLHPGACTEQKFKKLWEEYEWENKIPVNSKLSLPSKYVKALKKELNAKLVTPVFDEDAIFIAANLNAKSKFEEDCLINISIELTKDQTLSGQIWIWAKTEGMAGCIGTKIKSIQKKIGKMLD